MADPIRMTWPQYLRRECTYRGEVVHLTPREAEVLALLLMGRGQPHSVDDLVGAIWYDDDDEPANPGDIVRVYLCKLRKRFPDLLPRAVSWHGYCIERHDEFEPLTTTEVKMTEAERLALALL